MKKLLYIIIVLFFLPLIFATSVGYGELTEGKVVWKPETIGSTTTVTGGSQWIVNESGGFLYNNTNTLFYNYSLLNESSETINWTNIAWTNVSNLFTEIQAILVDSTAAFSVTGDSGIPTIIVDTTDEKELVTIYGDLNVTDDFYVLDNKICNMSACFTLQELNATGSGSDKWIVNISNGFLYNSSDTFWYNDTLLNNTMDARVEELMVVYNASLISTTVGTLDSGDLNSITKLADGDTYNVSEVTGTPGFTIYINFTNVVNFNTVALRGKYEGGAGHTVALELLRVGVGWEEREEVTDQSNYGVTTFDVFIGSDFVDGSGTVQFRLNHDDNGINTHDYFLDAIFIGQVTGLVSGGSLGGLTGRDNPDLLPWAFNKNGSKNMTGNLNMNFSNITYISDLCNDTTCYDLEELNQTSNATMWAEAIDNSNATLWTHVTSDGTDHGFINQDVTTSASPQFQTLFLTNQGGSGFDFQLLGKSELQNGSASLTFDTLNTGRTLKMFGNADLGDWFDQSVKITSNPTFDTPIVKDIIFQFSGANILSVDRGGNFLGFQPQASSLQMSFERWNKDGDGTDNNNDIWWAEGTPGAITNRAFLQNGFITAAAVADRYFKLHSASGGSGNSYPLKLYTEANTNQLYLKTDGSIVMAGVYDDDIGTQRDLLINSSGHLGYDSSSLRYKENVKNMSDEISNKVYDLRPITYDKIEGADNQMGLGAEEVAKLYPQCVSYEREEIMGDCIDSITNKTFECVKDYKLLINKTTGKPVPQTVNYKCIISPILKEVQELNERVKYLEENCVLK